MSEGSETIRDKEQFVISHYLQYMQISRQNYEVKEGIYKINQDLSPSLELENAKNNDLTKMNYKMTLEGYLDFIEIAAKNETGMDRETISRLITNYLDFEESLNPDREQERMYKIKRTLRIYKWMINFYMTIGIIVMLLVLADLRFLALLAIWVFSLIYLMFKIIIPQIEHRDSLYKEDRMARFDEFRKQTHKV